MAGVIIIRECYLMLKLVVNRDCGSNMKNYKRFIIEINSRFIYIRLFVTSIDIE